MFNHETLELDSASSSLVFTNGITCTTQRCDADTTYLVAVKLGPTKREPLSLISLGIQSSRHKVKIIATTGRGIKVGTEKMFAGAGPISPTTKPIPETGYISNTGEIIEENVWFIVAESDFTLTVVAHDRKFIGNIMRPNKGPCVPPKAKPSKSRPFMTDHSSVPPPFPPGASER